MKSIDQQIKTAMAKKVVGRTTPGIPSRGAGSTPRCANRTRTGKSIPIPACRSGAEGFNSEFSNSHFDDLLVASLLGTRQRIAFKYNNGVVDSEITAVTDSSDTYTVNSGDTAFKAGHLAKAEGFTNAANNRIFKVASSTGTTVVAAGTPALIDETAPPGTAKLQVIGFEGTSGDITATSTGLGSTADYIWDGHVRLGLQAGTREAALHAVDTHGPLDGLTADEGLIIRFGRELLESPQVSDDTFNAVRARYGEQGLLELTAVMSLYTMYATILRVMDHQAAAEARHLMPR